MICQTINPGVECIFMTANGCSYNGGSCYPVVDQCEGCERIQEHPTGKYCSSYPQPDLKWQNKTCNFATHVRTEQKKEDKVINSIKLSKRKAAGKI